VQGKTKIREGTLGYLAHVQVGDWVDRSKIPTLEAALMTSELFHTATVTLEDAPGGVIVVATLHDKWSWLIAPAAYVLPTSWSVGLAYAENDLLGTDSKVLVYGQLGNKSDLVFGTFFVPTWHGTPFRYRLDLYAYDNLRQEYLNDPNQPQSFAVARDVNEHFLQAAALAGWTFAWWLVADVRVRAAYVYFRNSQTDDSPHDALARPEVDGWDVTTQAFVTADHRTRLFGLTKGAYAQVVAEAYVPGVSTYKYEDIYARAYYSWRFFKEHELELRSFVGIGRHLPFHEELTNGGETDLRGYDTDQFRGDLQVTARAEYSFAVAHWRDTWAGSFAFRALGFWDGGYVGFHFEDPSGDRNYLPTEHPGAYWIRNDVGVGFRVYVSAVVVPLLGIDLGYGIEGHSPEVYFELGLTDF
jgi:outer membrane protein insertion porin family